MPPPYKICFDYNTNVRKGENGTHCTVSVEMSKYTGNTELLLNFKILTNVKAKVRNQSQNVFSVSNHFDIITSTSLAALIGFVT